MHGPTADYEGDKAKLERFIVALNAARSTLRLDDCRDHMILGGRGHIYATPKGFWMMYMGGSAKAWAFAKRRLAFCTVTQNAEGEGCLFLDRVPDEDEAEIIRDVYRIRKRREYTPEVLEQLRKRGRSLASQAGDAIIDRSCEILDGRHQDSGEDVKRAGEPESGIL